MGDFSTLIDIESVATRLGITERHVRRLVAERRIPYVKVGRFVRFDPVELAQWIDARRVRVRSVSHATRMLGVEELTAPDGVAPGSVSRR